MSSSGGFSMDGKTSSSSDLLSRVNAFLPKLQAANQELLSLQSDEANDGSERKLLDATLTREDEGENDSGTEDDDPPATTSDQFGSIETGEEGRTATTAPTIEMTVALGSLVENPGITALLQQEEEDDKTSDTQPSVPGQQQKSDLLNMPSRTCVDDADVSNKRRKVLIEEVKSSTTNDDTLGP